MTNTTTPALYRSIDPLTQTVLVDSCVNSLPIMINLSQLFGSAGLRFHIAVEDYGIVNLVLNHKGGELYLTPGEFAKYGQRTRLAVRATDREGDSVATTILVHVAKAVKEVSTEVCAA